MGARRTLLQHHGSFLARCRRFRQLCLRAWNSFRKYVLLRDELYSTFGTCCGRWIQRHHQTHRGHGAYVSASSLTCLALPAIVKEIRFWNTSRDLQTINKYRDASLSGLEFGLLGYYRLDDNVGSGPIVDSSPNNKYVSGREFSRSRIWLERKVAEQNEKTREQKQNSRW